MKFECLFMIPNIFNQFIDAFMYFSEKQSVTMRCTTMYKFFFNVLCLLQFFYVDLLSQYHSEVNITLIRVLDYQEIQIYPKWHRAYLNKLNQSDPHAT